MAAVAPAASLAHKPLFLFALAAFCFYSGLAQGGVAQTFSEGVLCFNNKFVYNKCNQEYRLPESGELHVPPEATDQFCHGPCFSETEGLLKCIDNMFSNFVFFNRATTRIIRKTIRAGCSYGSQRGNFDVGDFFGSELNDAGRLPKPGYLYPLMLMAGWIYLLL